MCTEYKRNIFFFCYSDFISFFLLKKKEKERKKRKKRDGFKIGRGIGMKKRREMNPVLFDLC